MEYLERKSRSSGIELRNIPKSIKETKADLSTVICELGKTLDVDIDSTCIRDVYRTKSKDSSNPIIVDFTTVLKKEETLKAVRKFNNSKTKGTKLNTIHINPYYEAKPIYIAETLTHKTHRIYYLARRFQKSHGYKFCWTSNGMFI